MTVKRPVRLLGLIVLGALLLVIAVWLFLSGRVEAEVEARYVELRRVMRERDMEGFAALLVPRHRGRPHEFFDRMDGFAVDLVSGSDISVWGDEATVVPRVDTNLVLIKIGHGVHLERVDGEWFFTGRVSVN